MTEQNQVWLTPKEAARYLKVSVVTLSRYLNHLADPIPSYKFSKSIVRISKAELDGWIKRNRK